MKTRLKLRSITNHENKSLILSFIIEEKETELLKKRDDNNNNIKVGPLCACARTRAHTHTHTHKEHHMVPFFLL